MGDKVVAGKTWMRDRRTGEAVLVVQVDSGFIRYRNRDCDGLVKADRLELHFEVLESMPEEAESA